MLEIAFLSIAASVSLQAPAPRAAQAPPPIAAPAELATRVAIVGASLSDGCGLELDVGARTSLADIADIGLIAKHDGVVDSAAAMMFVNPEATARQELAAAVAKNATLVVGIDLLFWFGYGRGSDSSRLERFERGLALLERCSVPLIVGDLPDMSAAVDVISPITKGPLLRADQMPSPEALKKLNERLREWAASHPNVVVVPLSELLAKVRGSEEIRLRGNAWPKEAHEKLMQADKLHTTLDGTILCWLASLDALVTAHPEVPASLFEWNAKTLRDKLFASKAKDRKEEEERVKRRNEKEAEPPPPPPPSPEELEKKRRP